MYIYAILHFYFSLGDPFWVFHKITIVELWYLFQECFDPIVDAATERDLIPSMVYG